MEKTNTTLQRTQTSAAPRNMTRLVYSNDTFNATMASWFPNKYAFDTRRQNIPLYEQGAWTYPLFSVKQTVNTLVQNYETLSASLSETCAEIDQTTFFAANT
jgi:hypothetical protein